MDKVVEVANLRKSYGEIKAVNNISFSVAQGEIFGMLGPNGAGKTTTMEIVEGLRDADSGSVAVLGMDIKKHPRKVKSYVGVQLQATALYPRLTVREVLDLFGSFFPRHISAGKLIKMAGLEDSKGKRCINLSGGQQQRLSVALALVNNPRILFLDEPTTGLDPQSRRNIWRIIEAVRKAGKTVFLTTHYMEEAERLCDRVAVIDHGKIIATDRPDRLVSKHFEEQAIEFELDQPIGDDELGKVSGVTSALTEDGKTIIYSSAVPTTISGLLELARGKETELSNLHVRRATLEDVFLKLTGRRIRE
jgi:ABC-2 type transport system ATP-binding protein